MIRQRLLLAVVALVGATPTANRLRVRPTRSLSIGAYVRVTAKRLTSLVRLGLVSRLSSHVPKRVSTRGGSLTSKRLIVWRWSSNRLIVFGSYNRLTV